MKKTIEICEGYCVDEYKIIKDHGDGFLIIELKDPMPKERNYWLAGHKLFLVKTNRTKQNGK